jgi:hypothetical protein
MVIVVWSQHLVLSLIYFGWARESLTTDWWKRYRIYEHGLDV